MTATQQYRTISPFLLGVVCTLLALVAWCDTARPALQQRGDASLAETWNPRPDEGDITLPMPGGLSMAFRVVAVPVQGILEDMPFFPGRDGNHARPLYDHRYSTGISAPFTAEDAPASWRKALPDGTCRFYLIAKYEVSRLQWRAVMENGTTVRRVTADDARPMTGVSWYEALSFTERWTEWLLRNHPDALPRFAGAQGNTGYVRLPTEAEWEYAARGGHGHVTTGSPQKEDAFSTDTARTFSEHAVYQVKESAHSATGLEKIGTLKPNQLGLYDMAGNAAEMTIDTFHFSMDGHLLGSAGGFVRKGGSFLSGEDEIQPGRREETAFFLKNGPQRPRDLGLRPVISGIITADDRRRESTGGESQRTRADLSDREKLTIFKEHMNFDQSLAFMEVITWNLYCSSKLCSIQQFCFDLILLDQKANLYAIANDKLQEKENMQMKDRLFRESISRDLEQTCAAYISALRELAIIDPTFVRQYYMEFEKSELFSDLSNIPAIKKSWSLVKKHWDLLRKGGKLTTEGILADARPSLGL